MINKRLINLVPESKKYIAATVLFQSVELAVNIRMIFSIATYLQKLLEHTADIADLYLTAAVIIISLCIRYVCILCASRSAFLSSKTVKRRLRELIFNKLLRQGASYAAAVSSAEIVQISVEGVEQLETYFGAYLPQFFYSMVATIGLFIALSFADVMCAAVFLVCVLLIPVTIALVQTIAKRLLGKYWTRYASLGNSFLENLQGLTTLKIYKADQYKNEEMNKESELFRKITMKVLIMQLNSITIMDVIAYGGASLGIIISLLQFRNGAVTLGQCVAIILLSADFFIPMRRLGSLFHTAMNGIAASGRIFRLLDLPEPEDAEKEQFPEECGIRCRNLYFSYSAEREILHGIDLDFAPGGVNAIVGESGSGKSTIASILMGRNRNFTGDVFVGSEPLTHIREQSIMKHMTYVGSNSYLFTGTVRDNLLMGTDGASDDELWSVLKEVNIAGFLHEAEGLETRLSEQGSNFSGGQRQRLAIARALLHDSPVYIFDEATSNIDADSENEIMECIYRMSAGKTVVLITHRLANARKAQRIFVLQHGSVAESGRHDELIGKSCAYAELWKTQCSLEKYNREKLYEKAE